MRFVFDTNAVISAALSKHSTPGRSLRAAIIQGSLLLSEATLVELAEVFRRSKFDRYLSADEREQFLGKLLADAIIVDVREVVQECRDPRDDKFLELAVAGNAGFIVTGDDDLLRMHPFRGIDIVTPAQLLHRLTGQS